MLRRPVEQPQGLGPRRGIELARPRPDLDSRFDRPEPQILPHGVARDLELARDTFSAPWQADPRAAIAGGASGVTMARAGPHPRRARHSDGIPGALYTDRAHWAVHTPTSGSAPDRTKLTQVGRAVRPRTCRACR